MIVFPAVDIQGGKAVRLKRGKKEDSTVFADNPLDAARHWQSQGAGWLHIVDLDGAFEGTRANAPIIGKIARETGIPVQVGGGIRTLNDADHYLSAGATRLIIGTAALEQPKLFKQMCAAFPGRIGVSLDGENGRLKSRGWVADAGFEVKEVLPRLEDDGAAFVIYTDIERDGMQCGINVSAIKNVLQATPLPVIAAGGIATIEDIQKLLAVASTGNLEGAISGRALYDGTLNLAEAMKLLAKTETN